MSSSSGIGNNIGIGGGKKALPPKLEDDLNQVKLFRQGSQPRVSQDTENIDPTPTSSRTSARRPSANSALAHVFDDSAERAMYDEILGPLLKPKGRLPAGSGYEATRLSAKIAAANNGPTAAGGSSVSTSTDFTTTILQRLKVVEAEAKDHRSQLALQITKNQQLEEEVEELRKQQQATSISQSNPIISTLQSEIKILKHENSQLQKQIADMEDFLADYGLEWVGMGSKQEKRHKDILKEEPLPGGHAICYVDLYKCIQELNAIIYAEPSQVIKQEKKARLANASELLDRIRVIYYRNGLMIKRGPFRPCESTSYLSFIQDVADGYFPSEFRKEYPDGVTFELVDKQDIDYVEGKTNLEDQMSTQQFLNRLPKTMVKNGEIIDVRNSVNLRLMGNAAEGRRSESKETDMLEDSLDNSVDTLSSSVAMSRDFSSALLNGGQKHPNCGKVVKLKTEASESTETQRDSLGNRVRIQIKWIDHSTLVAVMYETSTIRDIKREIAKHLPVSNAVDMSSVEFRSAFPPKLLMDSMTLMEASLVPSGTIHTRQL